VSLVLIASGGSGNSQKTPEVAPAHMRFVRLFLLPGFALWLAACAGSGVRQVRVDPLGNYAASRVAVTVAGDVPEEVKAELRRALADGLRAASDLEVTDSVSSAAFHAELTVQSALGATTPGQRDEAHAGSVTGRLGRGSRNAGRLLFDLTLRAPASGEPLGVVRYERRGDAGALLGEGGFSAGQRLGREMTYQRERFVKRRAADERLFLTPTPLTLEKGAWFVSDDQLLLVRMGVGVHRRIQLDAWFGGLPVYGAFGAGGAAALFGVVDLGVKVAVLEESRRVPGLSISYDFLNVFGIGALGALTYHGAAAAGGTRNLQFNLFALSTSKHFGNTQLVLGSYLLDNHHFIPQRAITVSTTGSESRDIERVPLQVRPFLAIEQVLGRRASLAAELLPHLPLRGSVGTLGGRWLLGGEVPRGPLAADRVRFRLDVAAVIARMPGAGLMVVPWLGIGLYVGRKA
jgi:hypothetical protein